MARPWLATTNAASRLLTLCASASGGKASASRIIAASAVYVANLYLIVAPVNHEDSKHTKTHETSLVQERSSCVLRDLRAFVVMVMSHCVSKSRRLRFRR